MNRWLGKKSIVIVTAGSVDSILKIQKFTTLVRAISYSVILLISGQESNSNSSSWSVSLTMKDTYVPQEEKRKLSYKYGTKKKKSKKSNLILSDADRKSLYPAWILYNASYWRHSNKPFLHTHPIQVFIQLSQFLSFRFISSSNLIALSIIYWFSHSCSEPSRLANEGGSIRDESRHVRTWSGFIWRSLTISMRQRRLHECTLWLTCSSSKSGSSKYKFAKSLHWFLPIEIKGNPWHNRFRVPSVPWLLHSLEKQCPTI